MEQKITQLKAKLEADPSFAEKLFSLETPEEVQSLLKEQGLELTLEEINSAKDDIVQSVEKGADGELSDENLEGVAGGGINININFDTSRW
ncbi:MAG: Nif11-like leader peptide family natural product precursor [Firmicutes bacterium]|nr:Nif11-like leader peptide family natural product precursor [Bacillota bacterium]